MALQFQPPNFDLRQRNTRKELAQQAFTTTMQVLPQIIQQMQIQKAENSLRMAQLQMEQRRLEAELGTGQPAPRMPGQEINMPSANVGSTFMPGKLGLPPQVGVPQYPQKTTSIPGRSMTPEEEGSEAYIKRVGTKIAGMTLPDPTKYMLVDSEGNMVPVPSGYKLINAPKSSDPIDAAYKEARTGYYQAQAEDVPERMEERKYKMRERRNSERTKILDRFNADPAVKKSQQSIDGANMIMGLANAENPIAAGAIPTFMARASGEVGNLSEADKRPFGGSRAILRRLEAAAKEAADGKLTEENKKFILDLANIMENRARMNIDNLARQRAKQYSRASDFLEEEGIYYTLQPNGEFEKQEENMKAKMNQPSVAYTNEDEKRYQELLRKRGK